MNITPWPTKTSSSMVTPSQTKVCDDTLQRRPMVAPFWISTKAPIFVPAPTWQPYRLTSSRWKMTTPSSRVTLSAMGIGRSGSYQPHPIESAQVERREFGGSRVVPRPPGQQQVRRQHRVGVVDGHGGDPDERRHPGQAAARAEEEPRARDERQLHVQVGARLHQR